MQKDGMRAKDRAPALLRCWENSQGLFSHPSAMREGSRGVWALAKEKGLIGPTDWFQENLHLERVSAPPGRGRSKNSRSRAISAALPPRPEHEGAAQPLLGTGHKPAAATISPEIHTTTSSRSEKCVLETLPGGFMKAFSHNIITGRAVSSVQRSREIDERNVRRQSRRQKILESQAGR